MAVKQTAGRTALGEFAPKFAELNDDVLFGQIWSREDKLSLKERSLITVVAILAVILVITAVVGTDTSGPIGSAFQTLVKNFIDQANKNTGLPTP